MQGELVLSVGLLAPVVLEGFKYVIRLIMRKPAYDFTPLFYDLMLPFTTALTGIALGFVGWVPMPDVSLETLLQWILAILLQLVSYHLGIKPFKEYRAQFNGG